MFDIGFWEISLIGVIALLVIGPDRLPGAARTVGLYVGRIRRYVNHVQADIQRELRADELRKLVEDPDGTDGAGLREVVEETKQAIGAVKGSFQEAERDVDAHTMNWVAPDPATAQSDAEDHAGLANPSPEDTTEWIQPKAEDAERAIQFAAAGEPEAPTSATDVDSVSEPTAPDTVLSGGDSAREKASSSSEVR